jgi:hypothetical protein
VMTTEIECQSDSRRSPTNPSSPREPTDAISETDRCRFSFREDCFSVSMRHLVVARGDFFSFELRTTNRCNSLSRF